LPQQQDCTTARLHDLIGGLDEADELGPVAVGVSATGAGGERDNILNGSIAAILAVAKDHTKLCHSGGEPETVGGFTGLFYVRANRFAEQLACQPVRLLIAKLDVAELAGGIFEGRAHFFRRARLISSGTVITVNSRFT